MINNVLEGDFWKMDSLRVYPVFMNLDLILDLCKSLCSVISDEKPCMQTLIIKRHLGKW